MSEAAEAGATAASQDAPAPVPSICVQTQPLHDELRSAAVRMRLELPLKERVVHLQTFKYTFTGQQAVVFLQQQGLASNLDVAVDLCQRMLSQGLFKSIYHRELFAPDGEVYRFSSSFPDGNKQKGRIPGSITSTGLYKEIAKIGKTAAQPFKTIQLSFNDTFNSLGSLSMPAAKPGQLGSSPAGGRLRNSASSTGRTQPRRSQTSRTHHVYSDSMRGAPDSLGPGDFVSSVEALRAVVKDSTSLIRLDLQQHTALQEHLVGALMAQQDSTHTTQLLLGLNTFAVLLLVAFGSSWTATAAAGCMMFVLLYVLSPGAVNQLRQAAQRPSGLLNDSVPKVLGIAQPLRKLSQSLGGTTVEGAEQPVPARSDGDHESDEAVEVSVPCLEDFEDWPDAPVMVCADQAAVHQGFELAGSGPCNSLPINGDAIPFETELFKGAVAVHIRHLPTTASHFFKGKKRLAWVALQGMFKRPVLMEDLVYGMEFSRQLANLPAPWFLENMLLPLARKISPSLRMGTLEDPFFFSPIITASQVVNVALPGQAPPLMDAKEDMRLLLDGLGGKAGDGLTVASRRRYFQNPAHRNMTYSMDFVWTFHLWQEYIDYASYMLNLGYSSYDLTQHLDGQPLQLMAKDESTGQQLISLHVWHVNLVRCLQRRLPLNARSSHSGQAFLEHVGVHGRDPQVACEGTTGTDSAVVSPTFTAPQTAGNVQQQHPQQQVLQASQPPRLDTLPPQQQEHQAQSTAAVSEAHSNQLMPLLQPASVTPMLQQQQSGGVSLCMPGFSPYGNTYAMELQQDEDGPTPSGRSDSRLQRPRYKQRQLGSDGSLSDPDNTRCSTQPGKPQLSSLRPAMQSTGSTLPRQGGSLPQQLSLPMLHPRIERVAVLEGQHSSSVASSSHFARAAEAVAGADLPSISPEVALVAEGANTQNATQWNRSECNADISSPQAASAAATVAAAAEEGTVCTGHEASSCFGRETPAQPEPLSSGSNHSSAAATAAAAMLKAQPHLQQSRSAKSKQRQEHNERQEQQRQQLHGLSVMGAL